MLYFPFLGDVFGGNIHVIHICMNVKCDASLPDVWLNLQKHDALHTKPGEKVEIVGNKLLYKNYLFFGLWFLCKNSTVKNKR